jgi:hypothetical protein
VGTLLSLEHTPEVAGGSTCLAVWEEGFLSLYSAMKRYSKSLMGCGERTCESDSKEGS